jgi:hypothetical protein
MTPHFPAALAALLLASTAPLPSVLSLAPSPAAAQSAVAFENLGFKGAFGAVTIPRIVIEGTNATKAEVEALFDPAATGTVAQRLSRISARSISIPMIEIRQDVGDTNSVTVYKDTVLRNVQNGVIGEMLTPTMTTNAKVKGASKGKPAVDMDMTFVNMAIKGFDVPQVLRAFFEKGQPNEPLKVVATEQVLGKMTMKLGPDVNMTIAGASMRDFKMRAMPTPLMDILAETKRNEIEKGPDWEKKNLAYASQMLTMFALGTLEMNGLVGSAKEPGSDKPATFAMDKMAMSGGSMVPEKFTMQGFRVNASGSTVNLGEITFDGIDTTSLFAFMQKVDKLDAADSIDPAQFMPKIALIRFAGIDIDVPDKGSATQRVKAKLGLFETKMANHVGVIPANIAIALDRFQMDIPANTKEKGLQDILALGYKALDVSARYNQTWDEASKTLKLNELSVKAANMLSATAKADIGNVPRDLFNTNKAIAAVAALGVSARSVDVAITNDSLFEKLIEKQARETRRKPEDVRAELAAGATLMIPMMLGDHPAAKVLGPVLGKFVANPKNLKVTVTAKNGGLGATDFMAVGNPMDLLKKVDIQAAANE